MAEEEVKPEVKEEGTSKEEETKVESKEETGAKAQLPPTSSQRDDQVYVESAKCLAYSCPKTDELFSCLPGIGNAYQEALDWLVALKDTEDSGSKDWSKGWLEDCSLGLVLMVCCCPCIINSRNMAAVTGESCEKICCWTWLTCCCACCYIGSQRTVVRDKYDIKGARWKDCLFTCFLIWCIMAQESKEVYQQVPGYYIPLSPMTDAPKTEDMSKE